MARGASGPHEDNLEQQKHGHWRHATCGTNVGVKGLLKATTGRGG